MLLACSRSLLYCSGDDSLQLPLRRHVAGNTFVDNPDQAGVLAVPLVVVCAVVAYSAVAPNKGVLQHERKRNSPLLEDENRALRDHDHATMLLACFCRLIADRHVSPYVVLCSQTLQRARPEH